MAFQAMILEWVAFPFSRGIFPTQGLNPGLLHGRQILYQLSYQGSPYYITKDLLYHRLKGHEFEEAPGDGESRGSPACCRPRGPACKEQDSTELSG